MARKIRVVHMNGPAKRIAASRPMAKGHTHVWVLEIAIFHALRDEIAKWEIWSAHTTRNEAIAERDRSEHEKVKFRLGKEFYRIRKYVPEPVED